MIDLTSEITDEVSFGRLSVLYVESVPSRFSQPPTSRLNADENESGI